MIEYRETNAGDTIDEHDVLRVTFAETPHWFVPNDIASMNLAAEMNNLMTAIDAGNVGLTAVSDPTVPPGAQAWTVDFMLQGRGRMTVSRAVTALDKAFRTLFISNGYIAVVQKITANQSVRGGIDRGKDAQKVEEQTNNTGIGAQLTNVFGTVTKSLFVIGGVAIAIVYATEIKALLKRGKK